MTLRLWVGQRKEHFRTLRITLYAKVSVNTAAENGLQYFEMNDYMEQVSSGLSKLQRFSELQKSPPGVGLIFILIVIIFIFIIVVAPCNTL